MEVGEEEGEVVCSGAPASEPRMRKQESPRGTRGADGAGGVLADVVGGGDGVGEEEKVVRRDRWWAAGLLHRRSRHERRRRLGGRTTPAAYLPMSAS